MAQNLGGGGLYASFPDNIDLNDARVGKFIFYLLGDVLCHFLLSEIVDFCRIYVDADLTAGGNREGSFHPREALCKLFQLLEALDVGFHGLAA